MAVKLSDYKLIWPKQTLRFPVRGIHYSPEEFARIQEGYPSQSTDEKWDMGFEEDRLVLWRSWTGFVVYQCLFEANAEGAAIKEILVSGEAIIDHELCCIAEAWFLIGRYILKNIDWEEVRWSDGGYPRCLEALMRRRLGPAVGGLPLLPATPQERLRYLDGLSLSQPPCAGVYMAAGLLHEEMNNDSEAEASYTRALALEKWARLHLRRAWTRSRRGLFDGAVDDLELALRLAADEAPDSGLRDILFEIEHSIRAHREAWELRSQGTEIVEMLGGKAPMAGHSLVRGFLRLLIKDWAGAIRDLTAGLEAGYAPALAVRYRGYAYLKLGEERKALRDFDAAIAANPLDALALFGRASIRCSEGNLEGALEDLKHAVLTEGSAPFASLLRGKILAESGREPELARRDLDRVLSAAPELKDEVGRLLQRLPAIVSSPVSRSV